jgi:hypothetical protein
MLFSRLTGDVFYLGAGATVLSGAWGYCQQEGAGFYHNCMVNQEGKVKCWGGNESGGLGYNTLNAWGDSSTDLMGDFLLPVNLGGYFNGSANVSLQVVGAKMGNRHACAILSDPLYGGTKTKLKCWGRNEFGQLGLGAGSQVHACLIIHRCLMRTQSWCWYCR